VASFMKQRLIGAIVLISLGIIFIPMLLTGRGNVTTGESASNVPPKPTYEIKAPAVLPLEDQDDQGPAMAPVHVDEGQDNEQTTMASTEASTEPADQGAAADEQEGNSQDQPAGGTDTTEVDTDTTAAAVSSKPRQTQTTASADESQPPASKSKASDTKDQSAKAVEAPKGQQPVKTASSKPAVTAKEPAPVNKTVKATTKPVVSGWVVQLGSFSVEKNALKLRNKLRNNGHASFVEQYKHDGKTSYRVRVGPEQTRELAEQLKTRLKDETKLNGLVMSFPK
jgi:DedD protein